MYKLQYTVLPLLMSSADLSLSHQADGVVHFQTYHYSHLSSYFVPLLIVWVLFRGVYSISLLGKFTDTLLHYDIHMEHCVLK